ncbi:MAG: hypothetical protein KF760_04450 [Candidatus Eremiobacteraeota bacterium]|nr:hypothetical protein [Candidatus Eremiobacteraeota bacterium]MCW5872721.1 hypothetical protein [Candidatus Eremiobacteraeota bacterium]
MRFLLLAFLLSLSVSAQPTPSPTPDPSVRHASETDKSAIFGYMINARTAELRGNSMRSIYRQCFLPALICGILTPLYLRLSRRRTIRFRG